MANKFFKDIVDENIEEYAKWSWFHKVVAKFMKKFCYERMYDKCVWQHIERSIDVEDCFCCN